MAVYIITGAVCLSIGAVLGVGAIALMIATASTPEHEVNLEAREASLKETEESKMADVDCCAVCGRTVPEGMQVCGICLQDIKITAEATTPDIMAVHAAARVIKHYCKSRDSNPATDCVECPIKQICYNEPYSWEV